MTVYYKDKNRPNRIKECRVSRGLSQPDLCKMLGFISHKATIYQYESYKRLPNPTTLIKLSEVLKVSIDYLLCLDDYKNHYDYIVDHLGLRKQILSIFLQVSDNENNIKRINKFLINHYKEVLDEI